MSGNTSTFLQARAVTQDRIASRPGWLRSMIRGRILDEAKRCNWTVNVDLRGYDEPRYKLREVLRAFEGEGFSVQGTGGIELGDLSDVSWKYPESLEAARFSWEAEPGH